MKKLFIILLTLVFVKFAFAIDTSAYTNLNSESQFSNNEPSSNYYVPPSAVPILPNTTTNTITKYSQPPKNNTRQNSHYDLPKCIVFGCTLFGGDFSRERLPVFNPEYSIAIGDQINIKLWGGRNMDLTLTVDAQGNIFIPTIGPIKVLGISNNTLTDMIKSRIQEVYTKNVGIYAGMLEAQPIMVYVGGNVVKPGAYAGTSSNSLMYFLDLARGIDQNAGSFLEINLIRNNKTTKTFNLYDFLLNGQTPDVQFMDGDMIYVDSRKNNVKVSGLVVNKYDFEFDGEYILASDLISLAKAAPSATHIRVTRNSLPTRDVEYYSFANLPDLKIYNGDEVVVLSDKMDGTITVRIEGEHIGEKELALPYGSRLSEILQMIEFSPIADKSSIQLYRKSVAAMQKEQLLQSLNKIEMSVLKANSDTVDEAKLRLNEAELIMKWVERAKDVEPSGQILLSNSSYYGVILENGDILKIPNDNALVHIYGEILFPITITYEKGTTVEDLIEKAGGLSNENASNRIVIKSSSGMVAQADSNSKLFKGDEVMVLPEVDVKSYQLAKDISQIIYQIAVSAGVLLAL